MSFTVHVEQQAIVMEIYALTGRKQTKNVQRTNRTEPNRIPPHRRDRDRKETQKLSFQIMHTPHADSPPIQLQQHGHTDTNTDTLTDMDAISRWSLTSS